MKRMNRVRRRALIIQNPGDTSEFRRGVLVDARRFPEYLVSCMGGAWEEEEITVAPIRCSLSWIENYFRQTVSETDYYLILFTGHGDYSLYFGPRCYLLNGQCFTHAWLEEKTEGIPTLFLTDSCQGIESLNEGGKIERKTFSAVQDSIKRPLYRQYYDEQLRKLPSGMFVVGSSVSPGELADEDTRLGGHYVRSLLSTAAALYSNPRELSGIYCIAYIHMLAEEKVKELSEGEQTPYITGYTRSCQPPFMIKL